MRNGNKTIATIEHSAHICYILRIQLRDRNKRLATIEHTTHIRYIQCIQTRYGNKGIAIAEHVAHIRYILCIQLRNRGKRNAEVEHIVHSRYLRCIQLRNGNKGIATAEHVSHIRYIRGINLRQINKSICIIKNVISSQHPIQRNVIFGYFMIFIIFLVPIHSMLLVIRNIFFRPSDGTKTFCISMTSPFLCCVSTSATAFSRTRTATHIKIYRCTNYLAAAFDLDPFRVYQDTEVVVKNLVCKRCIGKVILTLCTASLINPDNTTF